MGADSKIEWTDHTFNPWRGCTKVSAGCAHCYADTQSKRNPAVLGIWGPNGTRVVASEAMWREPLKWNRRLDRPRVFCASLADVFEDWQGRMSDSRGRGMILCSCGAWYAADEGDRSHCGMAVWPLTMADVRRRLLSLIDATPNLDWLVLTKRPENVLQMVPPVPGTCVADFQAKARYRENLWLGVSVEDQATADERIPQLLKCRDLARFLFVSYEPALGPVDFTAATWASVAWDDSVRGLDWLIIGGESGPQARPFDLQWGRDAIAQCRAAGVPVFMKQLGAKPFMEGSGGERFHWPCGYEVYGGNTHLNLEDRKGGNPDEWPEDLRAREYPA